jgi:AraC-like DNA-binding protein
MNKHAVLELQRIEQEKVIMADESALPVTLSNDFFVSPNFVISLCHKGSCKADFDMRPIEFKQHDIAVMLPDHIIGHGECSEDYSTTMIVIDREFFDQLTNRESFSGYLKYKNRPNYHLNEEQYSQINTLLATLRLVIEIDHPKRIESLANLLDILFYALTDYRGEESLDKNENRNTFLFNSFYDLLIENYQQHHEIAWYSEKLCLTPKYFSGVIRQITGKSAAQWINEVLVLHANRLLYTRRDMNVQQIAYELGFKGNANFCRFFKDQTGLRPSEYRKQQ